MGGHKPQGPARDRPVACRPSRQIGKEFSTPFNFPPGSIQWLGRDPSLKPPQKGEITSPMEEGSAARSNGAAGRRASAVDGRQQGFVGWIADRLDWWLIRRRR
jgi:hypothetical protein